MDAHARRASEAAATMPRFSVSMDTPTDAEGPLLEYVYEALAKVPTVNGAWRDGAFVPYDEVRVAVALGLVAPVLSGAGDLEALKARDPESFTAAELAGATFTVVFALDADSIEPLLVPRQAAVLGVGRARVTLACDARAVSVEDATAFLFALVA